MRIVWASLIMIMAAIVVMSAAIAIGGTAYSGVRGPTSLVVVIPSTTPGLSPGEATMIVQNYSPTPEPTRTPRPPTATSVPREFDAPMYCNIASDIGTPCIMTPHTVTPVPSPTVGPCPSPQDVVSTILCLPSE